MFWNKHAKRNSSIMRISRFDTQLHFLHVYHSFQTFETLQPPNRSMPNWLLTKTINSRQIGFIPVQSFSVFWVNGPAVIMPLLLTCHNVILTRLQFRGFIVFMEYYNTVYIYLMASMVNTYMYISFKDLSKHQGLGF